MHALPSFEEFYIGYADRSRVAPAEIRTIIGPAKNGMVVPILIRDGEIIGRWRPPAPAQRSIAGPEVELFTPADVSAALARSMAAIRG